MLLTESGFDILKPKSALHGFLGNFSVFFRFKYPKEKIYEFFCEFLKKLQLFPHINCLIYGREIQSEKYFSDRIQTS